MAWVPSWQGRWGSRGGRGCGSSSNSSSSVSVVLRRRVPCPYLYLNTSRILMRWSEACGVTKRSGRKESRRERGETNVNVCTWC